MATAIEPRMGLFLVWGPDGTKLATFDTLPDARVFRDTYDETGDIQESKRAVIRSWRVEK